VTTPGRDVLLVFLKQPRPGAVKTRLAPALGAPAAAELYRLLAEEEVRQTTPLPGEYERTFCFAPAEARAEMEAWFPGEVLVPQEGRNLGSRMAAAFAMAFDEGARRVAIIGSDVPWVSRAAVGEALAALDDHDVVLGPARDGGYYLLALAQPQPALFHGIAWSTPSVLAATVERAGDMGLSVRRLEPLSDIDTMEDLRAEWSRLAPLLRTSAALRAALAAVGLVPERRG
jgi:rSAM/selenodomain-associated transferase 1